MTIGPALVLAILVGGFQTALYVLIRGSTDGRLALLLLAACLGAWAGDTLGGQLEMDLLRIGDFRTVAASLMAWVGIAIVTVLAVMGPSRTKVE